MGGRKKTAGFNTHINDALLLLDSALDEIENGFVRCKNCGEQEDTKDLDFVAELKAAMAELLQAVERLRTEAMTDCLKECIPYCTCKETGSPMPCDKAEPPSDPAGYKALSFKSGQKVVHVKSGDIYTIVELPSETELLEHCMEPYYRYKRHSITWIRRKSEMEDGRFEPL